MKDEQIESLIIEFGPSEVLRAITRIARKRYEEHSAKRSERWRAQAPNENSFSLPYEPRREERVENDTATAWLCLDVDWAADGFERRIARAGESRQECCEREKKEEIAKLESQLASVKKTACVG